jgi:Doubled CXXCH motif (Paired_CXXCH_1)
MFSRTTPTTALKSAMTGSILSLMALAAFSACGGSSDSTPPITAPPPSTDVGANGTVLAAWKDPVVGATVYLIPADGIDMTEITAEGMLDGTADAYDEPLEDLVRSGGAATFPQATTGDDGTFVIAKVDSTKRYYPFVAVDSATPANLYPGGNLSRRSLKSDALADLEITLSGHASANAKYVGSSLCLICHKEYETQKTHAHRLGFKKPGIEAPLQDISKYPGFDDGLTFFKEGTTHTVGTQLFYGDFDSSRGFDKFRITPAATATSQFKIYLWKDTANNNTYKITMQNLVTTSDPDRTFEIKLTYGGAVYKQRMMLKIPDAGYKGLYPFLQYQHQGDDSYYDRTRNQWRDYHADWYWDPTAKVFKFPAKTKNIERNCMACHATGYSYNVDAVTGEVLCDATDEKTGAYDIDGDSIPDEINTGCEACHGPGSEHATAQAPKFIVTPANLTAARESQICGRCHDRQAGADSIKNDQPLNAAGEMMAPGESRHKFLTEYVSRKGPKLSSMWADTHYSKSHHQQFPDLVKSKHWRGKYRLLSCTTCHDLHGNDKYAKALKENPRDGTLCNQCHHVEITEHMIEKTGSPKAGRTPSCTDCHFTKIAKSGAGTPGVIMGTTTGGASDAEITYWKGDISSHLTTVPFSNNKGVVGVTPGKAMPIPYTNSCATCHNPTLIKYQK